MTKKIVAFGALNTDSYIIFREHLEQSARAKNLQISLICAGPYPNATARSEPARPLRAEALEDDAKRHLLCTAVAADARHAGAGNADILCMPCMSMIGFHDMIEQELGRPITRLADALAAFYRDIDKIGVLHMRPAKKRIEEIFGTKAITPDAAQAQQLLSAEEQSKKDRSSAAVENTMKEIAETWCDQGIKHILFARADAPLAEKGLAGAVSGVIINSTFKILASHIVNNILSSKI